MPNGKYLSFTLEDKNVKIGEALNKDFLPVELWMISDAKPNNNGSHFVLDGIKDAIPTIYNKPILGSFTQGVGEQDGDFGGHDSELTMDEELELPYFDNSGPNQEVPLGLITESSKIEIVEKDGLHWLVATGLLWCKYATKPVLALLRRRDGHTKVSVEVEVMEGHDEDGVEFIDKFNFLAVTMLGSRLINPLSNMRQEIHEGIEGAHLNVLNFSQNPEFQDKLNQLVLACAKFEKTRNEAIQDKCNNSDNNDNNDNSDNNDNTDNNSDKSSELNTETKSTESVENEVKTEERHIPQEGEDIYHPEPEECDNEEVSEIGFDEKPDDEIKNVSEGENSSPETKETHSEQSKADRKEFADMTYMEKRQILDSALSEAIKVLLTDGIERVYSWVNDFTETDVYFVLETYDGSSYDDTDYVAPYTLTMISVDGEERVESCVINLAMKERVVRSWKKYEDEGSVAEKTNMENMEKFENNDVIQDPEANGITVPEHFEDGRAVPAPHNDSDVRDDVANKSGDERGVPTKEYEENPDDSKKETNAEENPDSSKEEPKEEPKEGKKEENAAKDVVQEEEQKCAKCGKSVNDCDCDDNDDNNSDKHNECKNFEEKFTQLSADYVEMQKENETLKAMNKKFQDDLASMMEKVNQFEAEKTALQNDMLYKFGMSLIDAEEDISADAKATMSAELKAECEASKFASEDEVKKFAVSKIAMCLYEARKAAPKAEKKEEFVQNVVKSDMGAGVAVERVADKLAEARKKLEQMDAEEF